MKKGSKKTNKSKKNLKLISLILGAVVILAVIAILGVNFSIRTSDGTVVEITTEKKEPKTPIESTIDRAGNIENSRGEIKEIENIPTYEEVDGGRFEDADTGKTDGEYQDLGATIETFDTTTPEAFMNATLNRCIYANNIYGAQCVSLARSFWFSYANRDVSTCGTGMAKGMMNCAEQNAGEDFLIFWSDSKSQIQAGDWLIFDGGIYGHVGMSLGPVVNGYVTLLGENQGGIPCEGGGSATNIINININKLIGFYRPKKYIKPTPKPEEAPNSPDTGIVK